MKNFFYFSLVNFLFELEPEFFMFFHQLLFARFFFFVSMEGETESSALGLFGVVSFLGPMNENVIKI